MQQKRIIANRSKYKARNKRGAQSDLLHNSPKNRIKELNTTSQKWRETRIVSGLEEGGLRTAEGEGDVDVARAIGAARQGQQGRRTLQKLEAARECTK